MIQTDIQATEKLKEIKQSFRLLMNGVTAQSLRDKGLDYHLNWGANLLHLREMAKDYTPDHQLAQALWKEDVRECKIMATLLMPKEDFPSDLAMLWIEQTKTQEIAEVAVMNLYQHLPYASDMAFQLIASPDEMMQMHGFLILASLFRKGMTPNDRDINEFLDQAVSALQNGSISLKHSALNAVQHFANIDDSCLIVAKGALKFGGFENFL